MKFFNDTFFTEIYKYKYILDSYKKMNCCGKLFLYTIIIIIQIFILIKSIEIIKNNRCILM